LSSDGARTLFRRDDLGYVRAVTLPGPRAGTVDALLAVERISERVFTACLDSYGGASFGGQTLGCAARAVALTCPERPLHSLHAIFLRPVPPQTPIELRVEVVRDGRRFAHRRVQVCHAGRLLCDVSASFTSPASGPAFGDATPAGVPEPESLADDATVAREEGWQGWSDSPIEWRWVGKPWQPLPGESSRYAAWIKPRQALADDAALRAAAVAYLSDFHSHWPAARILGRSFEPIGFVSLDQSVWVHADEDWNAWRLLISECDVATAGRALTRRQLWSRDGRLLASMAQESLITDEPA
jgi:acyl-CoA thioesterase-2